MSLRERLQRHFHPAKHENRQVIPPNRDLLPWSILYSLKYGGTMGKSEALTLVENSFSKLALFLIVKLLKNEESKAHILEKVYLSCSQGKGILIEILEEIIKSEELKEEVDGKKIASLHRMGLSFVEQRYLHVAQKLSQADALPILVAHSTLVGFTEFCKVFYEGEKPFGVFFPKNSHPVVSIFLPSMSTVQLSPQAVLAEFPQLILIDDSVHTGKTLSELDSFFSLTENPDVSFEVVFSDLRDSKS